MSSILENNHYDVYKPATVIKPLAKDAKLKFLSLG